MMALSKLTVPLVALSCITVDQCSKSWARANLMPGNVQSFMPGFLQFNLTTNTGGAFGIGRDLSWLMATLAVLLTSAIVLWIIKREQSPMPPFVMERIGLALVLGGALGNLCDRFMIGHVTDFLEFAFVSFPVFNVADMAIDAGIAFIVVDFYIKRSVFEAYLARGLPPEEGTSASENK